MNTKIDNIKGIHIFGASCSGTTTLAEALAKKTGFRHFDTDRYFFKNFPQMRNPLLRNAMLDADLRTNNSWILSGSLCGWGNFCIRFFDLVVYLFVPTEVRLARFNARGFKKYGSKIFKLNTPEYIRHQNCLKWASEYDAEGYNIRSGKLLHERWIKDLLCPVMRLEGDKTVEENMKTVLDVM